MKIGNCNDIIFIFYFGKQFFETVYKYLYGIIHKKHFTFLDIFRRNTYYLEVKIVHQHFINLVHKCVLFAYYMTLIIFISQPLFYNK